MTTHECVFVEEQETEGRLILPPCIVCGCTAMDALSQLREPVGIPDDCALVTASLTVSSYLRHDGGQGYFIHTKGDSPMTTYLGLTVVAQRDLHKWGTE